MRVSLPASLVLAAALLGSCADSGDGAAPGAADLARRDTRTWPAGCVLAVDDVPIFADEVDRASAWIAMIEPRSTPPHLRRLALTNVVLPEVLRSLVDPEAREEALGNASSRLASLRAGTFAGAPGPDGALGTLVEGTWQDFGIPAWGLALELPKGEWSEVVEDGGSFAVFRVLAREAAPVSAATWFQIDLFSFPYLPPEGGARLLEEAYDQHTLTIVDPAWRELVPELIQHRMHAREAAGPASTTGT